MLIFVSPWLQAHESSLAQVKPLSEVLEELSERYQVLFSYDSKSLAEVTVDFHFQPGESLEAAMNRLLAPTDFGYESFGEKYFVVYEKTRQGRRSLKQLGKHLEKIRKLEQGGELSLQAKPQGRESQLRQVAETTLAMSLRFAVSGTVKNEAGEPLEGATVRVKGSTQGALTNNEGSFSLNLPDGNQTLVVSYIGYVTQEIAVAGRSSLDIVMTADESSLDEVVVVGYGKQRKVDLTGSVSTLDGETVETLPVPNTLNLLQGQMAGVQISMPGGQPGDDQGLIRIRGAGSIGGGVDNASRNNPLVIIDGIQASLSDLGNLNPRNIDNISVLKDAASSAIYGAQAANGVILVTTKQGVEGKAKVSFDVLHGWQEATVLPEFLDSWEFAELKNESFNNAGVTLPFTQDEIDLLRSGSDPDRAANTSWYDELFRTAPMTRYNLNVSGGNDKISYLLSGGYLNQEGIMIETGSERFNFRTNITAKLNDRVKVGVNVWGFRTQSFEGGQTNNPNFSGYSLALRQANQNPGIIPVFFSNGLPAEGRSIGTNYPARLNNPVFTMLTGMRSTEDNRINTQAFAEIELLDGLSFRSQVGFRLNNIFVEQVDPTYETYRPDGSVIGQNTVAILRNQQTQQQQMQIDNLLTFDKTLGDNHQLNVLLGHSAVDYRSRSFFARGEDFSAQVLNAAVSNFNVGGSRADWALQSFFGRVNYSFKGRYLIESNLRLDGSSRFPSGNRYGLFPSLSAGWILSEENFMEGATFVDLAKLRFSWGVLGNQEIGNYPHVQTYNLGQSYVDQNGNQLFGVAVTNLANDQLRWEETRIVDAGIDLSLWAGALDITVDYFQKRTDGILIQLPLPSSLGAVSSPFQNAAVVDNRGWEFVIGHRGQVGNLRYSLSANFSTLKNEVIDFNGQEAFLGNNIIREGESVNSFFGFESIGIFQTQEEVDNAPTHANVTGPGDLIYKDQNNDGVINDEDRVIIGGILPTYSYGASINLSYRGFDFNLLMQGAGGNDVINRGFGNDAGANPRAPFLVEWRDRWTPENTATDMPRLNRGGSFNQQTSTFWIEDASFLRVKNLQLGYSLPDQALPSFISSLRVYASGQNLVTFTNMAHWDPERFPSGRNGSGPELYPQTKVYSLGIMVDF